MGRMTYGVRPGRGKSMLSYLYIPFVSVVLLIGIFCLVMLRSRVISIEYRIGEMETLKTEALRVRKAFEAEMAALASAGYMDGLPDTGGLAQSSDRKRVFYVTRDGGVVPYTAAYTKN